MADSHAGIIRITTLQASVGARAQLVAAAWQNAAAARSQPGCLSAEVASDPADPDRVQVISRWWSEASVQAFLTWHKSIAHASLRDFTAQAPSSVHMRVDAAAAFAADWEAWHASHEAVRADERGFLAITAAHWLNAAPERFDDVPGSWSTGEDGPVVTLQEGESLAVDGRPLHGTYWFGAVAEGAPVWASWSTDAGEAVVEIANFGGHAVLRPRHADNPTLVNYAGTPTYAPDPDWAVDGVFTAFPTPRRATVDTVVDGLDSVFDAPGEVSFSLGGSTHTLTAFTDGEGLRLLFTDATSGVTTYPASRNLHLDAPDAEGRVRVDFNRAVNLPCAYTAAAMCPLPPAENRLDVAIEAGEKLPR